MREAGPVGLDLGPRERAELKRVIAKFDGEFAGGSQTMPNRNAAHTW